MTARIWSSVATIGCLVAVILPFAHLSADGAVDEELAAAGAITLAYLFNSWFGIIIAILMASVMVLAGIAFRLPVGRRWALAAMTNGVLLVVTLVGLAKYPGALGTIPGIGAAFEPSFGAYTLLVVGGVMEFAAFAAHRDPGQ